MDSVNIIKYLTNALQIARDYVSDANDGALAYRGKIDISSKALEDLQKIDSAISRAARQEQAVWVSIRDGEIVGTPFGPEVPDGKYLRFEDLNSTLIGRAGAVVDLEKLLPCPFCGSPAESCRTQDEGQRNNYDTVQCTNCPAGMSRLLIWHESEGEHLPALNAAWNTRAREAGQ